MTTTYKVKGKDGITRYSNKKENLPLHEDFIDENTLEVINK